ncbi:hypothetical protein V8E54_006622 [Elaphomyces granulatus]
MKPLPQYLLRPNLQTKPVDPTLEQYLANQDSPGRWNAYKVKLARYEKDEKNLATLSKLIRTTGTSDVIGLEGLWSGFGWIGSMSSVDWIDSFWRLLERQWLYPNWKV